MHHLQPCICRKLEVCKAVFPNAFVNLIQRIHIMLNWLHVHECSGILRLALICLQASARGCCHLLFVFCSLAAEDSQRRRWDCQQVAHGRLAVAFGSFLRVLQFVISSQRCSGVWAAGLQSLWDAWETRSFVLHHHAEHWRWEAAVKNAILVCWRVPPPKVNQCVFGMLNSS